MGCGDGSRVWPFLATTSNDHVGNYCCPRCRVPVFLATSSAGYAYFSHSVPQTISQPSDGWSGFPPSLSTGRAKQSLPHAKTCARFIGAPDLKEEAKQLLLLVLTPRVSDPNSISRAITIETECGRCSAVFSKTKEYTFVLDPLGSGVVLPAGYVDDGSDLLLYHQSKLVCSLAFGERALRGPVPDSWISLDPLTTINSCLQTLANAYSEAKVTSASHPTANGIVDTKDQKQTIDKNMVLREVRKASSCGRAECVSLRELAHLVGWRRSWTSDDIDWHAEFPDVSQYIANACTGKIRVYFEWQPKPVPLVQGEQLRALQNEIAQRAKCLFCEQTETKLSDSWPFCGKCSIAVRTKQYKQQVMPFDTIDMNPEARRKRHAAVGWVRSFPYVKKPDKSAKHEDGSQPLPVNDKPCVGCDQIEYKPLFYYGYRAICPKCLLVEFKTQNSQLKSIKPTS